MVPNTLPAQLSIAEGVAGEAKHFPNMSARTGATGAVVSLMVTF
ncbi:hypothetical protein NU08_4273 [Flavobacterium anhuiense]|uniref:Uncharacterized protein n=1 Tax=Flavobacterium anhuiense TaxID=459526 RepID=A0A444VTJ6_9FLAO|nr:hypothetical protein NU08_4273 [Flavobacterium anhuiense]